MAETVGTLNLKIAQLERKLQILEKQRLLSNAYPDHLAHLTHQDFQARSQLQQLLDYREQMRQVIQEKGAIWSGQFAGSARLTQPPHLSH